VNGLENRESRAVAAPYELDQLHSVHNNLETRVFRPETYRYIRATERFLRLARVETDDDMIGRSGGRLSCDCGFKCLEGEDRR
jgi:hypothetical protein